MKDSILTYLWWISNASWISNGNVSGLGWSLKDQMGSEYFRLRACSRSLSALHAEMKSLLWATSCMRDMRITSIRFETNCLDLMNITTNPMDWPTFATEIEMYQRLQEDFEDVNLFHILRSRNGRADALAKEARNRGYIFSYIDQIQSDGGALRRIGLSAST
uniref:RNase H type-1 domain-containing protein n=1 Tax=Brassica oleracea var. oleracea TaxID=109376 RepID=A0A0D3C6U1_BRAOL